jgi:hypothetical protein
VKVCTKAPLGEERLSDVMLSELSPEPVIDRSTLDFVSRETGRPLLSLLLGKPDTEAFNDFVNTLESRVQAEHEAVSGLSIAVKTDAMRRNVDEEPPGLDDLDGPLTTRRKRTVDADKVRGAIQMLETYLDTAEIQPLLVALRALQEDPDNESKLDEMLAEFSGLGSSQGAVLTYATYIGTFFCNDPYSD